MIPPRQTAVTELERIEDEGAFAGLIGRKESESDQSVRKTRDLVAGVTRLRRYLDFLIDAFYSGEPDSLERRVRTILRIGVYELLESRTASHAAVHEAVETARHMVGKRVTGLVNGILRTIDRQRDALPEPDSEELSERLGVRFSHPTWMVHRWLHRFGETHTKVLLEHNNRRPVFGLRIRGEQLEQSVSALKSLGCQPSPYWEDFVRTGQLKPVLSDGYVRKGTALIQDEGAGGVVKVLDPQHGERILDACAAPGGKTFFVADLVREDGLVLAIDRSESRLGLLQKEAVRLGLRHVQTQAADLNALELPDLQHSFDRVLLDAPCTGTGVLSKRADLRWRLSEEKLGELTSVQDQLLESAAGFVKPGGLLVYSTCSLEEEENYERIDFFLSRHKAFQLEPVPGVIPEVMRTEVGCYQALPFQTRTDGAFAARMRKTG